MNSRQRRIKRMKSRLTADEKKVLELFRNCDSATFHKHDLSQSESTDFVSVLGEPLFEEYNGFRWLTNKQRKIEVTGFLKDGEEHGFL